MTLDSPAYALCAFYATFSFFYLPFYQLPSLCRLAGRTFSSAIRRRARTSVTEDNPCNRTTYRWRTNTLPAARLFVLSFLAGNFTGRFSTFWMSISSIYQVGTTFREHRVLRALRGFCGFWRSVFLLCCGAFPRTGFILDVGCRRGMDGGTGLTPVLFICRLLFSAGLSLPCLLPLLDLLNPPSAAAVDHGSVVHWWAFILGLVLLGAVRGAGPLFASLRCQNCAGTWPAPCYASRTMLTASMYERHQRLAPLFSVVDKVPAHPFITVHYQNISLCYSTSAFPSRRPDLHPRPGAKKKKKKTAIGCWGGGGQ